MDTNGWTESDLSAKLKLYRLSREEYERVCELLGRAPQGVEWALFSALWSEHCSYKSSRVHLKSLYSQSPRVVQSFGENAGVVDLGEGERIAFKIESHNHPSFIEPYQGAATGVGGILRDIFTMGARPIALADYLCFGRLEAPRMKALVDGVVRGIGGYGNCVGVPTITGQTEFHSSYDGNILVNAMAVGLFRPGEEIFLSKARGPGNWLVYVGAKTGRDGVHGASMASESFEADSAAKRPTVQIGDPFYEKLLIESCLEVMAEGLVAAIQDMGAAGLTSSSFEMAAKGGVGLDIRLDEVPLRDETMLPEEILLSESQERMLLVCEPPKFARLQEIFHRWGLDACRIGEVTERKTIKLHWRGELLTEIDPGMLTENAPAYDRPYAPWTRENAAGEQDSDLHGRALPNGADAKDELARALRSAEGGSREFVYKQYDSKVGARTARDCADSVGVVRLPDSGRALGVTLGCRPHIMRFDAKVGGFDAVAFPALELACKGFEPLAVTDCLNFGNPERERTMTEFVAALSGMNAACEALRAPIISGNVSFYNETTGKNVTSTPSTGLIGLRHGVDGLPRSEFTIEGESVFLLRLPQIWCGGALQETLSGRPARGRGEPNPAEFATFVRALTKLAESGRVTASRAVGKFGLAYALARMCLRLSHASEAPGVGVHVELAGLRGARPNADLSVGWESLFEERLYEALIVLPEDDEGWLRTEIAELAPHVECHRLGQTGGDRLSIEGGFEYPLAAIKADYESVRFVD